MDESKKYVAQKNIHKILTRETILKTETTTGRSEDLEKNANFPCESLVTVFFCLFCIEMQLC